MDKKEKSIAASNTNRTVFANENIDEYVNSLETIIDILTDVKNNKETLISACSKYDINYVSFRYIVPRLRSLTEHKEIDESISYYNDFDIENVLTFEEKFYSSVFRKDPNNPDELYSVIPIANVEKTINVVCDFVLTKKEKDILFDYYNNETYESIGKKYGITKERIRQIYSKAIRKLRHPSSSKLLKSGISFENIIFNSYEKNKNEVEVKEHIKNNNTEIKKENDILTSSILCLNLSVRPTNCLIRKNIITIGEFLELNEDDILKIGNLGMKSYCEIINTIKNTGIDIPRNKYVKYYQFINEHPEYEKLKGNYHNYNEY